MSYATAGAVRAVDGDTQLEPGWFALRHGEEWIGIGAGVPERDGARGVHVFHPVCRWRSGAQEGERERGARERAAAGDQRGLLCRSGWEAADAGTAEHRLGQHEI